MRYIIYASLKNKPESSCRIDEYGTLNLAVNKVRELRTKRKDINYTLVDTWFNECISC